jgi:hypothetical protein
MPTNGARFGEAIDPSTVAALIIIETLGSTIICGANALDRSAISGLLLTQMIDPSGSIISATMVHVYTRIHCRQSAAVVNGNVSFGELFLRHLL